MATGFLLLAILAAAALPAQDHNTAAEVTTVVRRIGAVLDSVLPAAPGTPARTLVLLVDTTQSLKNARFDEELARALARNAKALGPTRIGVSHVGAHKPLALAPTEEHSLVVDTVRRLLAKPRTGFENVYAPLRYLAGKASTTGGTREVLLVSLDNGDAEDNLEKTVARLRRTGTIVHVLTSEAYLADCYLLRYGNWRGLRGCKLMAGGDAPFVDLPWNWLFQRVRANEITPSGFAMYGLSRVAAATGGRVFLYAAAGKGHSCTVKGAAGVKCIFCTKGDHNAQGELYWDGRIARLAPQTLSRKQAFALSKNDLYFRATMRAWRAAARAGLIGSLPPSGYGGTSRIGRLRVITASLNFARNAVRATKAAAECEKIRHALERDLAQAKGRPPAQPRNKAIAELTQLCLQLTKVNLLAFKGWCEDIAPGLVRKQKAPVMPPERPSSSTRSTMGIHWTNLCLCHGVRPFKDVFLPGGDLFRNELAKLERMWTDFLTAYEHTPYTVALHRAGIARFHLTYASGATGQRPRPKARRPGQTVTANKPKRPNRTSASGGARAGGATTGGK